MSTAQSYAGPQEDIDAILQQATSFSEAFVDGDMATIVAIYTKEGKIFPADSEIMTGTAALANYWQRGPDVTALHVWKKVEGKWLMDIDIWNRIAEPAQPTADEQAVRAACMDYIEAF